MVRMCRECGKFFDTKNSQQVMCSKECRSAHYKKYKKELAAKLKTEVRTCLVCNTEFIPVSNNAKTCSDKCKVLYKKTKNVKKTGIEPAWMINQRARALGISYGRYVAYMEGRIRL